MAEVWISLRAGRDLLAETCSSPHFAWLQLRKGLVNGNVEWRGKDADGQPFMPEGLWEKQLEVRIDECTATFHVALDVPAAVGIGISDITVYELEVDRGNVEALSPAPPAPAEPVDFSYPALGQDITPSPTARRAQADRVRMRIEPAGATKSAEASSTTPKRSRRKTSYAGAQTVRANKVLKQLYPEGCPSQEEMSNADLLDAFADQYPRFKATEKPASRYGKPSDNTVLRAVGRKQF
jgi:hypothetical protein